MAAVSPLEHGDFRAIEKHLDEGNTVEAAARLAAWANAREHADAVDFLTTRLLFQRGRIDSDGALDRLSAILERVDHFPEAEEWREELEARTERTERSSLMGSSPSSAAIDPSMRPTEPPPGAPTARRSHGASAREADSQVPPTLTPPPASRAPSIPRRFEAHPYVDEAELEDDVTPTESLGLPPDELDDLRLDSSDPPPRKSTLGTDPPTRPDLARDFMSADPPTRPDLARDDLLGSEAPTRPSHMPFDHLRAKEQLSAQAGRYRGPSPGASDMAPRVARSRPPRGPSMAPSGIEQRIREAFQRIVQGRTRDAFTLLPEEPSPPGLRPAVRAALARVLLEMGQAERAAAEAALALEQAPDSSEARLAFVWSAVRYARQRDDAWSLEKAARTLKELRRLAGPGAELLDALGACIEARIGSPSIALRLAQQAVRMDPDSVDALAALAEAAALCGEERRAETALERLFALSESAAEQLGPRLRRLGVGEHGPTSSASIWLPLEHTLSSGAREVALEGLQALAAEVVGQLPRPLPEAADNVATSIARFFSLAPVFRHFGPYDSSLDGIQRLEVALDLLYGSGPRALDDGPASSSLWQLAGYYLGETLRLSCEGRWVAARAPEDATVRVLGVTLAPLQIVRHRITHGRHATLRSALEELLATAPTAAHQRRAAVSFAPVPPWGDREFPPLEDLPRLGRALGHSVVAAYALEASRTRLDRSAGSLSALDRYLSLIAPAGAPLPEDSAWARWVAVFVGAYLGEVLCKELGGAWRGVDRPDAEAFAVSVRGREIAPIARVLEMVSGRQPAGLAALVSELAPRPSAPPRPAGSTQQ